MQMRSFQSIITRPAHPLELALFDAIKNGEQANIVVLASMIANKSDHSFAYAQSDTGFGFLEYAINANQKQIAKYLLDYFLSNSENTAWTHSHLDPVWIVSRKRSHALFAAADAGDNDLVARLIAYAQDRTFYFTDSYQSCKTTPFEISTREGSHFTTTLIKIVEKCDLSSLKAALSFISALPLPLRIINKKNSHGLTALHVACNQSDKDKSKLLVHFGAALNPTNDEDKLALQYLRRESIEMGLHQEAEDALQLSTLSAAEQERIDQLLRNHNDLRALHEYLDELTPLFLMLHNNYSEAIRRKNLSVMAITLVILAVASITLDVVGLTMASDSPQLEFVIKLAGLALTAVTVAYGVMAAGSYFRKTMNEKYEAVACLLNFMDQPYTSILAVSFNKEISKQVQDIIQDLTNLKVALSKAEQYDPTQQDIRTLTNIIYNLKYEGITLKAAADELSTAGTCLDHIDKSTVGADKKPLQWKFFKKPRQQPSIENDDTVVLMDGSMSMPGASQ